MIIWDKNYLKIGNLRPIQSQPIQFMKTIIFYHFKKTKRKKPKSIAVRRCSIEKRA